MRAGIDWGERSEWVEGREREDGERRRGGLGWWEALVSRFVAEGSGSSRAGRTREGTGQKPPHDSYKGVRAPSPAHPR